MDGEMGHIGVFFKLRKLEKIKIWQKLQGENNIHENQGNVARPIWERGIWVYTWKMVSYYLNEEFLEHSQKEKCMHTCI